MYCFYRNIIIAMILVTIVLVFVICHSPKCIINLLELISIIRGNHLNETLEIFVGITFSVISYAKYSQNCWTPFMTLYLLWSFKGSHQVRTGTQAWTSWWHSHTCSSPPTAQQTSSSTASRYSPTVQSASKNTASRYSPTAQPAS